MGLLDEITGSKVRAEIFRLLFGLSSTNLHMREIQRLSGFAIASVRAELRKLVNLDLVVEYKDGNRSYFRANNAHPIYKDLRNLVLKTSGLVEVLCKALGKTSKIDLAFVFGSVARGGESATSDIDLFIIGDIGLRDTTYFLSAATEEIQREINPYVISKQDFINKIRSGEHFVHNVLEDAKLFIIGTENDLEKMG